MIHSFILNSKLTTISIIVITILLILVVEGFYSHNGVHRKMYSDNYINKKIAVIDKMNLDYGLIVGDSRGKTGISPEILMEKFSSIDIYNISSEGNNTFKLLNVILEKHYFPKVIFAVVSPSSIFGFFDSNYYYNRENISFNLSSIFSTSINNPMMICENYVKEYLNRNYKFNLGFKELMNVISFGEISKISTDKGWSTYNYFDKDYLKYAKTVNEYAYKYILIENYKNNMLIKQIKNDFINTINLINNKNIKIIFIRIPVSSNIKIIEDEKYPWFDEYIKAIAVKYNFQYLKYDNFIYDEENSDGSHLNKEDAQKFTELISKSIIIK